MRSRQALTQGSQSASLGGEKEGRKGIKCRNWGTMTLAGELHFQRAGENTQTQETVGACPMPAVLVGLRRAKPNGCFLLPFLNLSPDFFVETSKVTITRAKETRCFLVLLLGSPCYHVKRIQNRPRTLFGWDGNFPIWTHAVL